MLEVQDALGRPVTLAAPPRRIVSLVPSLTALLADLGLDEEVVGLTRFCVHPAGWKQRKRVVGGTKDVRPERVRELEPDLVLANEEENVRDQVLALEGTAPVYVTRVRTLEDDLAMVRAVGRLVGREARAAALAEATARAFAELPAWPSLRAVYLIWREPWMSVSEDTFIHHVMARGGFVNACAGDAARYPELSDEALAALDPEVVLLSSEPYPFGEKHLDELRALLPRARVELCDGEVFSWYGSRVALAPAYLRALRARVEVGA